MRGRLYSSKWTQAPGVAPPPKKNEKNKIVCFMSVETKPFYTNWSLFALTLWALVPKLFCCHQESLTLRIPHLWMDFLLCECIIVL
jgi:hypothetical protein